jgi:hypothetical protein
MREQVDITDEEGNLLTLLVRFDVVPTEYEGPYLFVSGGIEVDNAQTLDGKPYDMSAYEENQVHNYLRSIIKVPTHQYSMDY